MAVQQAQQQHTQQGVKLNWHVNLPSCMVLQAAAVHLAQQHAQQELVFKCAAGSGIAELCKAACKAQQHAMHY